MSVGIYFESHTAIQTGRGNWRKKATQCVEVNIKHNKKKVTLNCAINYLYIENSVTLIY